MTLTCWLLTAVVTATVGWLCTLLWRWRFESRRDVKVPLPLPPGSFGFPLVGETLEFMIKGTQFFLDRYHRYGKVYKTHYLGSPTVRLSGADTLGPLIHAEPHSARAKCPVSLQRLMGPNSVIGSTGQAHTRLRKCIAEAFSPARLSDYLPCIQQHVRGHVQDWCGRTGRLPGHRLCEGMVSDLALELILGCSKHHDAHGQVRKAFSTVNDNFFCLPYRIPGLGLDKGLKARDVILEFVRHRLATGGDKEHPSCLDVFLAARTQEATDAKSSGLTVEEIEDNIVSLMVAAAGTSSGAMSCALLCLAQHPHVQDRLLEELQQHGLLAEDCPEELTSDLLHKLSYTDCVIKEVLRLYPPAGGVFRQANKTIKIEGCQIPKDFSIVYSIRDTHHLAHVFQDPGHFRPERWQHSDLTERLRKEDFANYLPFGLGMRACPGRSLALMVLTVFLVECVRLTRFHVHNLKPSMAAIPVCKPADDLPITFTSREK